MEQFNVKVGARVHFRDAQCGVLQKVVTDSFSQRITDLIVTEPDDENRARVVPLTSVQLAYHGEIRLAIASVQLTHFPQYHRKDFVGASANSAARANYQRHEILHWVPYGESYERGAGTVPLLFHQVPDGIPSSREIVGRSVVVHFKEGILGRINHLWFSHYRDEVTHLLVQRAAMPYYLVVPISLIEMVGDDGVYTLCREAQIQELHWSRRRNDVDILAELYERLTTAPYDFSAVTASLENGIVCLRGTVGTPYARYQAAEIARAIRGIVAIEVLLESDADIVSRIVHSLSIDPLTAASPIEVTCHGGSVTMQGLVENEVSRAVAEKIAAKQQGVQSLFLALDIPR